MKSCKGSGGTAPHIVRLGRRWSGQFHTPAGSLFKKDFCTDSLGGWIGYSRDFSSFFFLGNLFQSEMFPELCPYFPRWKYNRNKKKM